MDESFEYIRELLLQNGSTRAAVENCRELWSQFTTDEQRLIYRRIKYKLNRRLFVHFNPMRAISDNAYGFRRKTRLSYREYYERYHTTEERDGWKQVTPENNNPITGSSSSQTPSKARA
ncbi:MAG: hypothetical protein II551_06250 [Paludibacteraceae bacterium]|nr:hypothetical protein [Paludibacteraceae bacterium]